MSGWPARAGARTLAPIWPSHPYPTLAPGPEGHFFVWLFCGCVVGCSGRHVSTILGECGRAGCYCDATLLKTPTWSATCHMRCLSRATPAFAFVASSQQRCAAHHNNHTPRLYKENMGLPSQNLRTPNEGKSHPPAGTALQHLQQSDSQEVTPQQLSRYIERADALLSDKEAGSPNVRLDTITALRPPRRSARLAIDGRNDESSRSIIDTSPLKITPAKMENKSALQPPRQAAEKL